MIWIITFALGLCLGTVQTPEVTGNAYIYGTVYARTTGYLVSDAGVEISGEQGFYRKAVTDKEGRYKIEGLPPGEYTVRFWKRGTGPSTVKIVLSSGESKLVDGGLHSGLGPQDDQSSYLQMKVSNVDDTPLQDATVTVVSVPDQEILGKCATDAEGRCTVRIKEDLDVIVFAFKPGFQVQVKNSHAHTNISRPGPKIPVEFTLTRNPPPAFLQGNR